MMTYYRVWVSLKNVHLHSLFNTISIMSTMLMPIISSHDHLWPAVLLEPFSTFSCIFQKLSLILYRDKNAVESKGNFLRWDIRGQLGIIIENAWDGKLECETHSEAPRAKTKTANVIQWSWVIFYLPQTACWQLNGKKYIIFIEAFPVSIYWKKSFIWKLMSLKVS